MYCDLWLQYIQVRKLFKGGNYSRTESIRGNTVGPIPNWTPTQRIRGSYLQIQVSTRSYPGYPRLRPWWSMCTRSVSEINFNKLLQFDDFFHGSCWKKKSKCFYTQNIMLFPTHTFLYCHIFISGPVESRGQNGHCTPHGVFKWILCGHF